MRKPTVRELARLSGLASDELLTKLQAIDMAVESEGDEVDVEHFEVQTAAIRPILLASVLLVGLVFAVWRAVG